MKILLLLLILVSCKNNKNEIVTELYLPNQSEFSESENYQLVNIKSFENFDTLVDSLENLNYLGKKAYLKIENNNSKYNVLVSTTFGQCFPPLLKFKNILSISKDTIKKEKKFPISDLKMIMKKDLLNYGKDNNYSDSPEKLVISLTTEIEQLEILIIKVSKAFKEIQEESSDSLNLNLFLNRRMEIYPRPPKIENIE